MKLLALIVGCFVCLAGRGQARASFAQIDWQAASLDAPTPDSLARLINRRFSAPSEKLRAIYGWITTHISYNTAIYKRTSAVVRYDADPLDTAAVWPSGDEMTARKVMRKRTAVCDGYAKLLKVLCDYTGIEARVIQGFARGVGSRRFATNHTWNVVRIDSVWQLLDVTWASGHLTNADDFVAQRNDHYYLTPPDQFINDHFPEDLRWTLLPSPPPFAEFRRAPFRSKNFYKYGVADYAPGNGIVEASAGDTLVFEVRLKDAVRAAQTSGDPFLDTADYNQWPVSAFATPIASLHGNLTYQWIAEPGINWIHLLYNNDVLLHYRIKPKEVSAKKE